MCSWKRIGSARHEADCRHLLDRLLSQLRGGIAQKATLCTGVEAILQAYVHANVHTPDGPIDKCGRDRVRRFEEADRGDTRSNV